MFGYARVTFNGATRAALLGVSLLAGGCASTGGVTSPTGPDRITQNEIGGSNLAECLRSQGENCRSPQITRLDPREYGVKLGAAVDYNTGNIQWGYSTRSVFNKNGGYGPHSQLGCWYTKDYYIIDPTGRDNTKRVTLTLAQVTSASPEYCARLAVWGQFESTLGKINDTINPTPGALTITYVARYYDAANTRYEDVETKIPVIGLQGGLFNFSTGATRYGDCYVYDSYADRRSTNADRQFMGVALPIRPNYVRLRECPGSGPFNLKLQNFHPSRAAYSAYSPISGTGRRVIP